MGDIAYLDRKLIKLALATISWAIALSTVNFGVGLTLQG